MAAQPPGEGRQGALHFPDGTVCYPRIQTDLGLSLGRAFRPAIQGRKIKKGTNNLEAISAIYKNGVLLPAQPLPLTDGTQLTVWIDPTAEMRADLTASDRQFFDRLAAERAEVFRRLAE